MEVLENGNMAKFAFSKDLSSHIIDAQLKEGKIWAS
jgi:hypothetical protein